MKKESREVGVEANIDNQSKSLSYTYTIMIIDGIELVIGFRQEQQKLSGKVKQNRWKKPFLAWPNFKTVLSSGFTTLFQQNLHPYRRIALSFISGYAASG